MKTAKTKADMAERFKATDLRPVIYDAWVRTPLSAKTPKKGNHPKTFFHDFNNHEKRH
jgi:hypothetical protein